ncbi:class I SAM-dependent methyltransferase [Mycolicibacterium sp. BiH015]|uniref:class I SAM-dependent methyltransferase n=1 Tax=Mycolicibacterium sp. BiH015 TaxID=3018808 RepID=UPI0022E26D64|nr:class I SAM-dependent methyltransferase [Mycolicibacterium sp. BiH015]MDA2893487.1 class I SAM-dependent methyltransferase [Mycolicibacterium sp. BiH015]
MDVSGLAPIEQTALLTEYCRALDSRAEKPILGDTHADATVRQIDHDFAGLGARPSVVALVALRAKMLDERIRAHVAANSAAVIVDIGAGLNSAVWRVDPPHTVDWFSVDLPAVIAVRESLLPAHPCARSVAASVLEPDWAAGIPTDRPAMVFADGLFAFLDEDAVIGILRRITGHFASGTIAFNDYGTVSKANQILGRLATSSTSNSPHRQWNFPGFKDARMPESWNPDLRLVEESSAMHRPEAALFPTGLRIASRFSRRIPSIARKARILQYRF